MKSRPASAVRAYENAVAQTASAAAQISMRTMASPACPRRSDAIMNGNAGSVLRIGTSTGTPIAAATTYEAAVPATMATGANAGFITKDYTPRMRALRLVCGCLAALLAQGCMASTVVLYVRSGGPARARIPPRLYLWGMRAFDAMFAAGGPAPTRPPQVEEELP